MDLPRSLPDSDDKYLLLNLNCSGSYSYQGASPALEAVRAHGGLAHLVSELPQGPQPPEVQHTEVVLLMLHRRGSPLSQTPRSLTTSALSMAVPQIGIAETAGRAGSVQG